MGIVAVRDGLVTTIQNHGKWAASEISTCDFGIANLSASCVIVQPGPNSRVELLSFGTFGAAGARNKRKFWDLSGIVLVKDPGDPTTFLGNLWTALDDIYDSVNSDDTLNGTACAAMITQISRPSIDAFITDGEVDFGFITFSVIAEEF